MYLVEQPSSPIQSLEEIGDPIISPLLEGPEDLIPGLLPKNGQLVIAGETDIGKSLVALEICSSLVTGCPLWTELEPTAQAKRILYVLGEHYNGVIKRLWQKTQLPMTDQVYIIGPEQLSYDKWLVANGKPNLIAIDKFKRWADKCDFIVWDPLAAFIVGAEGTENDNIHMRLVLDTMSLVAQSTGASSLVLAHQGKPMVDKFGQEHNRTKYAIRGASGIEDAATNIFYMGHAEGSSAAASRADMQILALTKRKYKGTAPPEYRLMRDPSTLCHTLLGNRPFIEVQRIATNSKVAKMQAAFPGMPFSEVIRAVAVMNDQSETTVKRYLGLVK